MSVSVGGRGCTARWVSTFPFLKNLKKEVRADGFILGREGFGLRVKRC